MASHGQEAGEEDQKRRMDNRRKDEDFPKSIAKPMELIPQEHFSF